MGGAVVDGHTMLTAICLGFVLIFYLFIWVFLRCDVGWLIG